MQCLTPEWQLVEGVWQISIHAPEQTSWWSPSSGISSEPHVELVPWFCQTLIFSTIYLWLHQRWTLYFTIIIARLPECDDCIWYFTQWHWYRDITRLKAKWHPYTNTTEWNIGTIRHMRGVLHLFHDVQHIWPEKLQQVNEKTLLVACARVDYFFYLHCDLDSPWPTYLKSTNQRMLLPNSTLVKILAIFTTRILHSQCIHHGIIYRV